MKVGSLVECITAFTGERNLYRDQLPVLGDLYVVRDIEQIKKEIGIKVEEIVNPLHNFMVNGIMILTEINFIIDKFREIQPPMEICVDELIEELV